MQDQGTALAAGAVNGGQAGGDKRPEHPVTVISSAVLRAGRAVLGDSREMFAARARVSVELVVGIEDGTRRAWDLPGPQMTAVMDALDPETGENFWTATSCDLLLTDVLSGDWAGVAASDALTDPAQIEAARMLLRWAVQGTAGYGSPLLSGAERDLLRVRAAELAASGTGDAWVGAHLLALFPQAPVRTRASLTRRPARPSTWPGRAL
jgi:hypothetical protein